MKLPIYKVLKISVSRTKKPTTLVAEWVKDDVVICEFCKHNVDGICNNVYGMYLHGVDLDDYCSRGERI